MKAHGTTTKLGKIILLGSGETQPAMRKVYDWVFEHLEERPYVSILETPAGFEPNSADVAGAIGDYLRKRLQNYRPDITVIPARHRSTPHSPDDPTLAERLFDANVIFMGPGSPTYAVRQLCDSVVWDTIRAMHRLGANLIFSSAMTIAASRMALPVYEIYKVGEDLHWKSGLNLFADYGLSLVFIPHWNNNDGGGLLDTSRCYMGQERFGQLCSLLPAAEIDAIVGIDENTALILDPTTGEFQTHGRGQAVLLRDEAKHVFPAGERFLATLLGAFQLPQDGAGIPAAIWEDAKAGVEAARVRRTAPPKPPDAVWALVELREKDRSDKNWSTSDDLRDQIAGLGWQVQDSPAGPQLSHQTAK